MTIRYECHECESVLKIKDERAGQQGKCPKCKTRFMIPEPVQVPVLTLTADDMIDLPLEVTPPVIMPRNASSASDEFDPLGVLNSDSKDGNRFGDGEIKPSVTELMQEHHDKRSRDEARRLKREQNKRRANPLMADVETSGSAADAITRSYDKKRSASSDAPPLTREERRAAEERAAILRFAVKVGTAIAGTATFAFVLFSYALSTSHPDLVDVTGSITSPDGSFSGYRIHFTPKKMVGGPELKGGNSSSRIAPDGSFVLIYKPGIGGALTGKHEVTIENKFGIEFPLPEEFSIREVTEDGDNHFDFNL
jgi:hypothetical protein